MSVPALYLSSRRGAPTEDTAVTEHARCTAVNAAGAAATAHDERGCNVHADLAVPAAVWLVSHLAMAAVPEPPDLMVKAIAILSGAALGALVAATLSDRYTLKQRVLRLVSSFSSGAGLSVVALWLVPGRDGVDPREWVFVVAMAAAFIGWHIMRKVDSRADRIADRVVDRALDEALGKAKDEDKP